MILAWTDTAWEDYLHWQAADKQKLKRINALIKDIMHSPYSGIGRPEQMIHQWPGVVDRLGIQACLLRHRYAFLQNQFSR